MKSFFLEKLPDHVSAGGKLFLIKTDFRSWLAFSRTLSEKESVIDDVDFIYADEVPPKELKKEAFNALPDWQAKYDFIKSGLSASAFAVFDLLPIGIQQQLFLERDPHGNVQVSLIESEKLFSELVKNELAKRKAAGTYKGKFSALHHFFGYEGRCAFPSNFDADYCYSLGYNAFMLIQYGYTGYLSKVSNISKSADEWVAGGMPITKMMNIERRNGADKPVIRKALVELDGKPFKYFEANRDKWAVETCFTYPGAIQYFGPSEVCDRTTVTLALEQG